MNNLDMIQKRCDLCQKWQRDKAEKVLPNPQGPLSKVSDLIRAAVTFDHTKIVTVAMCENDPLWSLVTDDHHCFQFVRRLDS